MNTTDFLTISAAICPERTAITFAGRAISFSELNDRVNNLAAAMAGIGVKRNDRVGLLQVNTPACVEVYFATARLGAIYVPLNFRARTADLTYIINNSGVGVIFVGGRYLDRMKSALPDLGDAARLITLDEKRDGLLFYEDMLAETAAADIMADIQNDDTTVLMYTASDTGFPKGVMLSHNSFVVYMLENVIPADPDVKERNILTVPLYHIAGMQAMMAAVYGGRTIIMQRQFEPVGWMELVQQEKADRALMVPTMLKQVMAHPDFSKYDLSSLRVITYGAAPMPFDVIRQAIQLFPGVSFINAFGQTESASTITALGPEDHNISGSPEEIEQKLKRLTSIGKPLSDVEIKIIDAKGNRLGIEAVGEIVTRGPRVMSGYWEEKDQSTKALDKDGWLHTGDIGYEDADGYYYLTGRSKDVIIRGGENVSPGELEAVLQTHPSVEDAAVIGVPSDDWGEEPRAIVVLKPGAHTTAGDIMEYCRGKLSSYQRPGGVVFIDKMPRNSMGKIRKRALREKYGKSL
jgi:acyl-CoA synthetase (AMP-forming)/AMP-acid ligase II